MNSSPTLSIAILNWNGKHLLEQFLPSVVRHSSDAETEIVVIDNGSSDASCAFVEAHFPSVRLIRLERNYGFAEGYNRAVREIDAPYLCLLNNDVAVSEGWTRAPLALLQENPRIAAVQPKIRSYAAPALFEYAGAAGGFIDRLGYPFCRGRIFETLEEDNGQYDHSTPIFWASGAALFLRRGDYEAVGGLDPLFFAHMEEIDLAWRLQRMGKQILYTPHSTVFHQGGASLQQGTPQKVYLNFRNNLLMLYKNLPPRSFYPLFVQRMLLDGVAGAQYLLQGKAAQCKAIFRAYCHFARMRKQYTSGRRSDLFPFAPTLPSFSVVYHYFIRGKKRYADLPISPFDDNTKG